MVIYTLGWILLLSSLDFCYYWMIAEIVQSDDQESSIFSKWQKIESVCSFMGVWHKSIMPSEAEEEEEKKKTIDNEEV